MKNYRKIFLIFFFLIFLIFLLSGFALAKEEKPLEIKYPQIPGAEAPQTTKTALPEYIKYIFNFSIIIGGALAFGMLVFGGFRYLLSAGNPEAVKTAREQIFGSVLGLVILLSAFLILKTIHPQLVILKIEEE